MGQSLTDPDTLALIKCRLRVPGVCFPSPECRGPLSLELVVESYLLTVFLLLLLNSYKEIEHAF